VLLSCWEAIWKQLCLSILCDGDEGRLDYEPAKKKEFLKFRLFQNLEFRSYCKCLGYTTHVCSQFLLEFDPSDVEYLVWQVTLDVLDKV
jgi:hypothetical protein